LWPGRAVFGPLYLFYHLYLFFPGATGSVTLQVVAPLVTDSSFAKGDVFLKSQRQKLYLHCNYK
jgi:hypothetical protein